MRTNATLLPGDTRTNSLLAQQWLGLALGVLVIAGLFALAVVLGRTPPFDRFVTDPQFFKRCLVAHVNLALVVWFYAFMSALLFLLPSTRRPSLAARASAAVAACGVLLLLAGAVQLTGRPLLSNYVPTLENPLFQFGQIVFAVGVLLGVLDPRLLSIAGAADGPVVIPAAARAGLRAVAISILLAAATLAITFLNRSTNVPVEVRSEFLMWGVGHVLQLVSAVAMVTTWLFLLEPALGAPPVSPPAANALFAALVAPWSMALVFALQGTGSVAYRHGFTFLMRGCLFPVVSIFLVLCVRALVRTVRSGGGGRALLAGPRVTAFLVSAALTVLGFVIGALIRGSNTMVPSHYHASVGGVTVAFMAATLVILPAFGMSIPSGWMARAAPWQSALYGLGMLVFAAGFAIAGANGMGRKLYGAEQAARGVAATLGLGLMGVGGLVAIAGGLLFLALVAASWWGSRRGIRRDSRPLTSPSWRLPHEAK
jgi:cytochrome c oxidase subunit 1